MEEHLHLKRDRGIQLEAEENDEEEDTDELRGERDDNDNLMLCRLQQECREDQAEAFQRPDGRAEADDGIEGLKEMVGAVLSSWLQPRR